MTPWCDVSLRVASEQWDTRQIAAALSLPADVDPTGRETIWTRSFAGQPGSSCDTQLDALSEFLAVQKDTFAQLPAHCTIDVLMGWTPASGEDHLYLAPSLIQQLAAMNAMVHVDTYTTDT